jgi:hypothetical protein
MTDIAIRVENLSKLYRIGAAERQPQSLGGLARGLVSSPFAYLQRMLRPPTEQETLWALRDVSFEVKRGEVVGIIGRNGAGKSTLLKIFSRITEPTSGRAETWRPADGPICPTEGIMLSWANNRLTTTVPGKKRWNAISPSSWPSFSRRRMAASSGPGGTNFWTRNCSRSHRTRRWDRAGSTSW